MTPWAVDHEGRGPAWSNSLFEDNAEFGLGFRLAADKHLEMAVAQDKKFAEALLFLSKVYIERGNNGKAADNLIQAVNNMPDPEPITKDNLKGECYAYLALALYKQNKKQEAVPYLEKAKHLRYVGAGTSGSFDLYRDLKIAPPQ